VKIKITSKVEEFIYSLEKQTIAKILRSIDLLERFNYRLGTPHSKKLQKDLYELRMQGKQEVRIFYTFHKNQIILFHSFIKKKQKTPTHELNTALKHLIKLKSN